MNKKRPPETPAAVILWEEYPIYIKKIILLSGKPGGNVLS